MKNLTIAGRIGKDAVTRRTGNGEPVTGWSVAVEERTGDGKRTLWFDVSMWGTRGEKLAQYLTKGTKVAVTGELSTREYDGKMYLTLRAADVTLQGGGDQSERGGGASYNRGPENATMVEAERRRASAPPMDDMEDSIPFLMEWR